MSSILADLQRPRIWAQMRKKGGRCGPQPMSIQLCTGGAQINFGDLTAYLTYETLHFSLIISWLTFLPRNLLLRKMRRKYAMKKVPNMRMAERRAVLGLGLSPSSVIVAFSPCGWAENKILALNTRELWSRHAAGICKTGRCAPPPLPAHCSFAAPPCILLSVYYKETWNKVASILLVKHSNNK